MAYYLNVMIQKVNQVKRVKKISIEKRNLISTRVTVMNSVQGAALKPCTTQGLSALILCCT